MSHLMSVDIPLTVVTKSGNYTLTLADDTVIVTGGKKGGVGWAEESSGEGIFWSRKKEGKRSRKVRNNRYVNNKSERRIFGQGRGSI